MNFFTQTGAAAFATGEAGGSVIAAVTMAVTAVFDPFFGMLAGIVLKLIISATIFSFWNLSLSFPWINPPFRRPVRERSVS